MLYNENDFVVEINKKFVLLSDMFDFINVLLNIGKGKKWKDKK